jgi:poly-gamma-glutamate synthesis protein (capsule biosynthesis protein)
MMDSSSKKRLFVILSLALILISALILFFPRQIHQSDPEDIDESISLLFLGDFMIGDSYAGSDEKPFNLIDSMLSENDEVIINLETSVTSSNQSVNPDKTYVYKMDPMVVETLVKHHISMANLANNHVMDYGKNGFSDTLQYLQQAQLSYFGAGNNLSQARSGVIKTYRDNTTVGYLGYFEYRDSYDTLYQFYAKDDEPGVAGIDKTMMRSDILRMKNLSDIVIVSLHKGSNYETGISVSHQDIARFVIDCGADAVICHSAHIVLPMELYHQKPIFYSVGNFIFTTPGRFRFVDEIYHAGMGVELIIEEKQVVSIELIPFKTNNRVTNYEPIFLDSNESMALFDVIIAKNVNATVTDSTARINLLSI